MYDKVLKKHKNAGQSRKSGTVGKYDVGDPL